MIRATQRSIKKGYGWTYILITQIITYKWLCLFEASSHKKKDFTRALLEHSHAQSEKLRAEPQHIASWKSNLNGMLHSVVGF